MSGQKMELVAHEAEKHLSERERAVYERWRRMDKPVLAVSLNAKLFSLFLNGQTCDQILKMNPSLELGAIIHARVWGEWDRLRKEHLDRLLSETSLRVQQATLETADFVCDLLAVANKEHGDRLRRYLQTGNEDDLGTFKIDSLSNLKYAVEVLQKLTGQDRQQVVRHSGEVGVKNSEPTGLPTAGEAAAVLKLLLGKS